MRGSTSFAPLLSHQLEVCPKLPTPKKIEVFVEKFDNQGISQANRTTSIEPLSHPSHSENWVTVAPKKRVKSMINPCNFRPSSHNTKPTNTAPADPVSYSQPFESGSNPSNIIVDGPPEITDHPPVTNRIPNPAPAILEGIILANLNAMTEEPRGNDDDIDEDMNEDENVDMYLNLHNIEDIEMSTDSSKRKRCEDGEEATSHCQLASSLSIMMVFLVDFFGSHELVMGTHSCLPSQSNCYCFLGMPVQQLNFWPRRASCFFFFLD